MECRRTREIRIADRVRIRDRAGEHLVPARLSSVEQRGAENCSRPQLLDRMTSGCLERSLRFVECSRPPISNGEIGTLDEHAHRKGRAVGKE